MWCSGAKTLYYYPLIPVLPKKTHKRGKINLKQYDCLDSD